ncbi:MAG: hypothetical protein ABIO39_10795 [Caulobacteraceae bacterium]
MADDSSVYAARDFKPLDREVGWPTARKRIGDFIHIEFGYPTGWLLVAEYEHPEGPLWVVVDNPVSYRVHDERELLDYWMRLGAEGVPAGVAYEIGESAYLAELKRGVSGISMRPLRHFLFAGLNICLEVIATSTPTFVDVRPKAAPARG